MVAIAETTAPPAVENRLRPFDVRRDLGEVADLVELCFADTLDLDGREYLARMRSAARDTSLLRMARGWATVPMTGYVWRENGRIVGNVSLIPYLMKGRRFFLIANVAVHPAYRRQGIARRMTEEAIKYSRLRSAPAVWLHVREENLGARDLYASLGFKDRAVRTTWLAQPDYQHETASPPGYRFIQPHKSHWPQMSTWLKSSYPPELSWHMLFHINNLHPGLIGSLWRLLYNTYIREWGVVQNDQLNAAVAWQAANIHTNLLWLAAPETGAEESIRALLKYVRRHTPTQRTLALDYPARQYGQAIREAGFNEQQTLVWMERTLAQRGG